MYTFWMKYFEIVIRLHKTSLSSSKTSIVLVNLFTISFAYPKLTTVTKYQWRGVGF